MSAVCLLRNEGTNTLECVLLCFAYMITFSPHHHNTYRAAGLIPHVRDENTESRESILLFQGIPPIKRKVSIHTRAVCLQSTSFLIYVITFHLFQKAENQI